MAHQLNTDYLRRKLLNPQRQVSLLIQSCGFFFFPLLFSPLPRKPHDSRFSFSFFFFTFSTLHSNEEDVNISILAVAISTERAVSRWGLPSDSNRSLISGGGLCYLLAQMAAELVQIILLRVFYFLPRPDEPDENYLTPSLRTHPQISFPTDYLATLPYLTFH